MENQNKVTSALEDLQKAIFYINDEIKRLSGEY